ncbi:MAG: hypothetical protein PVH17_04945 [Anaerolineae bacterium]|jgi:hypothetical protein
MPTTSRVSIKASIVHLGGGAVLGAILLINRWVPLGPGVAALKFSHVVMLIVGWLTQLILGVAWWLFPPLTRRPSPAAVKTVRRGQDQRGSEPLFWATFVCLNAGILLRAIFEPLYSWTQQSLFHVLVGISGLLLMMAAVAFVVNMWGRVRALGRRK